MTWCAQELLFGFKRLFNHKNKWVKHNKSENAHTYKSKDFAEVNHSLLLVIANCAAPKPAIMTKSMKPSIAPAPKSPLAKAL